MSYFSFQKTVNVALKENVKLLSFYVKFESNDKYMFMANFNDSIVDADSSCVTD